MTALLPAPTPAQLRGFYIHEAGVALRAGDLPTVVAARAKLVVLIPSAPPPVLPSLARGRVEARGARFLTPPARPVANVHAMSDAASQAFSRLVACPASGCEDGQVFGDPCEVCGGEGRVMPAGGAL